MNEQQWYAEMANLQSAKYLLDNLDVLTINFEGGSSSDVYVATKVEDKIQGLSDLDFLDTDGMLFYFSQDSYIPFTMKNMKLDLTIAFFNEKGELLSASSHKAGEPDPIYCENPPFRYVLECPAGNYGGANLKI